MVQLNATHDPARKSWLQSANDGQTDFPIQNLPHGVFSTAAGGVRGGVAIGDQILDMKAAVAAGLFAGALSDIAAAAAEPTLNRLMAMGNAAASSLRARLSDILAEGGPDQAKAQGCLVAQSDATMQLPAKIGAFTDFCTSTFHVTPREGRKPRVMHEAFKSLPVAYNSRATTVGVDGEPVLRPNGQLKDRVTEQLSFGPSQNMDYELEFGVFIGPGNRYGEPVNIDDAEDLIWGYVLVNDWSARDIQLFESMLGPFLSKSLRTTISPWVVTNEAMAPFHAKPFARAEGDPSLHDYLTSPSHEQEGHVDVSLKAYITSQKGRAEKAQPHLITDTNFTYSYWTFPQMVTHHTSNGCNLQTGDLLASGTVSGPAWSEAACLLEITAGKDKFTLPTGEERVWLEDGDEVYFTGRAQKAGAVAVGFGKCGAELKPAPAWPKSKKAQKVAEPAE
jgi:fumarylacetoacetase